MFDLLINYTEFGVAIFAIAVLYFSIVKFLKFMEVQEKNFKDTLDLHLRRQNESNLKQVEHSKILNSTIKELLTFLRYKNGNSKKKEG